MFHDIGEDMLVIDPNLILDEEIEFDRKTTLGSFHVTNHQGKFRIHLRALTQIFLHKPAIKLKIGWSQGSRILQILYILSRLYILFYRLLKRFLQLKGILCGEMLGKQGLLQSLIYQPDAAEIEINNSLHSSSPTLLHTNPVLERTIHQSSWRNGNDGIIEITHLYGSKRHILHNTIGIHRLHGNPVALVQHIITGESHTGSQTEDSILEHQHQDSRSSTQAGKQGHRTLTQQNSNHNHSSHKEHQHSKYAAEGMEILLSRRTALIPILQSLERTNENQSRTYRHHYNIDTRSTLQNLLEYRIFQIDKRHERPDNYGGNDMAGRSKHLLVEKHIIPRRLRLLRNLGNQRNQYLPT